VRILACSIDNFGGLQQQNFTFNNNLTVVLEHNGYGKTTLATFIRCMFYGMPRKSKSLQQNFRKKYQPWQGGNFGGSLTFEVEGRPYRIERTFGKVPALDTLVVYDGITGMPTNRFGEDVGLSIFGVDAESFERSTYFPQKCEHDNLSTASIQSKLGNLVDDAYDVVNYDKAMERLHNERRSRMSYRGEIGTYYNIKHEVSELETRLVDAKAKQIQLDSLIMQKEEAAASALSVQNDMGAIRQEINNADQAKVRIGLSKQFDEISSAAYISKQNLESLKANYPNGLPIEEDVQRAIEDFASLEELRRSGYSAVSPEEQARFADLGFMFSDGVPSDDDMHKLRNKMSDVDELHHEISSARKELLESGAYSSLDASSSKPIFGLLIAGIVLVIAGLVNLVLPFVGIKMFDLQNIVGIGCCALGIIGVILSFALKPGDDGEYDFVNDSGQSLDDLEDEMNMLESDIKRFLAHYGYSGGSLREMYDELQDRVNEYRFLEEKINTFDETSARIGGRVEDLSERVQRFFDVNKIPIERQNAAGLKAISDDLTAYGFFAKAVDQTQTAYDRFTQQNGDDFNEVERAIRTPKQLYDLEIREKELSAQVNEFNAQVASLDTKINLLTQELDVVPALIDELSAKKNLAEKIMLEVQLLDASMDYLQKAKENLTAKYLHPIRSAFDKYMSILKAIETDDVVLDTDLNISLNVNGSTKELDYMSAGYMDMVTICERMALVDALYTEEKPFVVLDDPFVMLDDEFTKRAIELLHKLSEDRQIIYLSCHSSRV